MDRKIILQFIIIFIYSFQICAGENIITNADLSKRDYQMVTKNVIGKSYGFLFSFLFGATSSESKAISNLVNNSTISQDKNRALANLNVSRRYIITPIGLFMIDEARADVIQYTDK